MLNRGPRLIGHLEHHGPAGEARDGADEDARGPIERQRPDAGARGFDALESRPSRQSGECACDGSIECVQLCLLYLLCYCFCFCVDAFFLWLRLLFVVPQIEKTDDDVGIDREPTIDEKTIAIVSSHQPDPVELWNLNFLATLKVQIGGSREEARPCCD